MGNKIISNNHMAYRTTEKCSVPNNKPKRQRKAKMQLTSTSKTTFSLNEDFIFTWILIWCCLEGPTWIKIFASLTALCGCLHKITKEEEKEEE